MNRKFIYLFLLFSAVTHAQEKVQENIEEAVQPMKWNLNKSGTQSVSVNMWTQMWVRSMDMNPGTQVNGIAQNNLTDFSLRRFRITSTFQLSRRFRVFMQLGANNQSFISGGGSGTGADGAGKRAKVYLHDAYTEYTLKKLDLTKKVPFSLDMGVGLHAWNGISRLSNASTNKMLTFDIPVYNYPTIEMSDQMGRQFGIFAHGEIGKLAYRVNLNKPFATRVIPNSVTTAVDNNAPGKLSYAGYFAYQFKDREAQNTSFYAGSYLGEKTILNVGLGFYNNNQGTATATIDNGIEYHNMNVLGLDVFYEQPLGDKTRKQAISLYSVLYYYDLGPNYIRTTGLLNPGVRDENYIGDVAAEGFGNNRFFFGTGAIWHSTLAYVSPKIKNSSIQLQPYVTYSLKDLKAMDKVSHFYDIGLNVILKGHNAKISLQYASRPLHHVGDYRLMKRAGEWQAGFQLFF